MLFNITFEVITPESAEDGDFAESGFMEENLGFREAYNILRWKGSSGTEASCSDIRQARWITFYNTEDVHDGTTTNYSLHLPESLSGSSRVRIARLFRCYGVK